MYKVGDRIAKVSLPFLRLCAGKKRFCYADNGVWVVAHQFEGEFRLTVRIGFKYEPVKFTVKTGSEPRRGHMMLKCLKCHKFTHRLFLDWDSQQGHCRACFKTPKWYRLRKLSEWVETDNSRFLKLFKKRIISAVAINTVRDFRRMKCQDFFALHPYLVPPAFDRIREHDAALYDKALLKLYNIYKRGLYRWKTPSLSEQENDWLDVNLADKMSRHYGITKGEREWLKENLLSSNPPIPNNRSGTPLDPLSSPPSETACSSSKTSSSPDTSAAPAKAKESCSVASAVDLAPTPETETPSSALSVQEPGSSSVLTAMARAAFSLSLNNPNADPVPEGLSLQATK